MARLTLAVVLVLAVGTAVFPAAAHKVVLSVYVTGALIEGEVGFSNGDMAPGAVIEVFGPDGALRKRVTTDEDGFFAFQADDRVDYQLKADLGAGHVAEARVSADELPVALAAAGGAAAAMPGGDPGAVPPGREGPVASGPSSGPAPADLDAIVQEAVAHQIRPLRRQLTAYENRVRWTDVLGGLGYIIGLTGLAAYWQARRRLREAERPAATASER